MRAFLPLVDGTRDRDALVAALASLAPSMRDPRRALDEYLAHFARLGILEIMTASTLHAGLKAAYEDIAYVGRPNHHSHPDRLAAVAALFGHTAADPSRARVLEVGCGDAANILPMAARFPDARFVACDYSALLMGHARRRAAALGLSNVELVEGDLREVAPSLGTFDYVIAHGFYSWVPTGRARRVHRDARRQLAPGGLAFISYNVLPGCFVRRIGWDAMRIALAGVEAPRDRLAAARREFADLAAAWSAMPGIPAHLGRDYAGAAERSDSALYHDDLSGMNDPVYFTTFMQHVGRHGLGFVAEAEPGTMSLAALPERMRTLAAGADALSREQYLDFARVRRFRQSIVAHTADAARARITPEAVDGIHVSAVTGIVQERASGAPRSVEGQLVDFLVEAYPASVPASEAIAHLAARSGNVDDARLTLMRGCFLGCGRRALAAAADRHARGPKAARVVGRAREAAQSMPWVTSLRHEGVQVDEAMGRAILAACDGTRDRRELVAAAGLADVDAAAMVDHYLERFALTGLLEA
jgi:SAM-dependent methyltransferase